MTVHERNLASPLVDANKFVQKVQWSKFENVEITGRIRPVRVD